MTIPETNVPFVSDWTSIKKLCEMLNGLATENRIRAILKNSGKNGANFGKRLGPKTILVSPSLFLKWFEKQQY